MNIKAVIRKFGLAGFLFFLAKGLLWLAIGSGALYGFLPKNDAETMELKVAVYDTYVAKKQGGTMHFDILVDAAETDLEKIYGYGRQYLRTKGQEGQPLTARQCRFCHVEQAKGPVEDSIRARGYYIIEMDGCN